MRTRVVRWVLAGFVGLPMVLAGVPAEARMCQWFGTAPFCEGSCPRGWKSSGRSKACFTGRKVECCEPLGSTTSDGPGSPYTDGRPKTTGRPKPPPVSSNNRFICEQQSIWPAGTPQGEAYIQKCLARLANRGK